jgi:signal peptidase I
MGIAGRLYREWRFLIIFLLLMSVFRSAVADWYTVPTGSMKPTILEGDRIFVNKMAYGLRVPFTTRSLLQWAEPQTGDVIIFQSAAAAKRLVKRVIGVPGDMVMLRENRLFINGRAAQYTYSDQDTANVTWADERGTPVILNENIDGSLHEVALVRAASFFGPVQVPEGHLFVMGDNRDNSADSRYIGFVPRNEVLGQAKGIIVSLNAEKYFLPRTGRYLKSFEVESQD